MAQQSNEIFPLLQGQPSKSGDEAQHCKVASASIHVNGSGSNSSGGQNIAGSASGTKLSDVFPSLLTAEDRKPSPPPKEPSPPLKEPLCEGVKGK